MNAELLVAEGPDPDSVRQVEIKPKSYEVLIPEYWEMIKPEIPTPCRTCRFCYIGAFEPDGPWATPIGIAYRNGSLGIGEGCTQQDPPDIERFEDVGEMLLGNGECLCQEPGGPIIYLPRWIQHKEVQARKMSEKPQRVR
jgi:hypothetical protein